MERTPNPQNPEDSIPMYENAGLLNDYGNEYGPSHVGVDENGEIYRDNLVRTVEERFSKDSDQRSQPRLEAAKTIPHKVERINMLANVLNTTTDVTTFKRAYNEMDRIVYGAINLRTGKKRDLMYPEPEFDPDLLGL